MNFRSKFDHQQNQKANITNNYQGIIPDRKLTVKRGVFPYAIHANPVSKREVFRKDQHVSNKNDSFLKPMPKNTFNLFDKKVPNENPQFEKNKPSVSAGFFGSNTQHPVTPINFKKPQNDNVTFSSTTNVTRINKNVLLNKYVTQQYNAVFNANNQKPKNTSNVFDEKVSNEGPQFENKTRPSTSTGFFGSTTPQPTTPINVKKPQNDHSNASNTTEMNKNILLNEYVTEQYNAVFNAKTSTVQPKYINFDSQEALQICTYQKIGEVINQSFIEASSKFECSLERATSIRDHLRKFHKERRKYAARKRDHHNKNAHADPLKNRQHHEKKHAKNKTKFVHKDSNFLENDTLSPRKGNEVRNQFKGGNDRTYRSPSQCSLPEKNYDWRNLTPSSSPDLNYNFIRNFEEKKQESGFLEKLDDRNGKRKRSPLLPTQRKNVPLNNHPKCEYKAVNSPTLFFSDTEESIITPKVDKSKTKMPSKDNNFSLDSAVFKRKFSPEFRNPIDILKRTRGKSDKKKTKRKKITTPNPSYSDSTCHGVNPFKRNNYERNRNDEFYSKYKYSKFDLVSTIEIRAADNGIGYLTIPVSCDNDTFRVTNSTCFVDAGLSRCPDVTIQHGRIRYSGNRARRMKISCMKPYTLIGNSRLECEHGEWNGPMPVCASKNCEALPKLLHGKITYFNDKAIAKMQCNPDFTLIGSSQMHCTGSFGWNDTVIPECRANSIRQFGICHFEPNDTKHCEWVSKNGLFNWTIMSSSPEDNTHMPVGSFPSHDHTSPVSNSSGHFLYLEALVAPTKTFLSYMNTKNATAKYISPLFPPFDEDEPHCLIFYLYANGSHAGIVEVLMNQDSIWRSNGSLGTEWKKINIPLRNRSIQFRITIEGKGELGHYTSTAIDDLRIAVGGECEENHQIEVSANADVEQSITKSFSGIEDYEDETERSHEVQANQSSLSLQSPKSKFENTSTTSTTPKNQLNFTASNSITTDNRTGSNTHITDNESMSDDNNNAYIKVEDSNSTTETIIMEHNVIFHRSADNKSNDDDNTLVEHEIHMNSTHDHENDNDLRINIPPTSLSSNESSIKEENQEFDRDMTILQHQFSNKTEKILSNISAANTSYVVPISNDPVVESNDAENEYDHQEENSGDEIEEKRDDPRHFENEKNVLQKSNDQNKEIKYYYVVHPDNDHSNGSGIFWVVMSIISVVMLLFFVLIYKRYYRNRRKDTSSMQFLAKDDGCSDSFRTKDDVLMLNCVLKNL